MCPVRGFENYLHALNPKANNLWQQANIPGNSQKWYKAIPLGHNPLDTFMSKLSEKCKLSQQYTNHCICVTGVSNLMRSGDYTAKQVMAITGHKSIHSLAIYQCVHDDEKMMMGMSLTYSLLNADEVYKFKAAQLLKQKAETPPLPTPFIPQAIASPEAQPGLQMPHCPAILPSTSKEDVVQPIGASNILPQPNENVLIPYHPANKAPLTDCTVLILDLTLMGYV